MQESMTLPKVPIVAHIDPSLKRQAKSALAIQGKSYCAWLEDALCEMVSASIQPSRVYIVGNDMQDGK